MSNTPNLYHWQANDPHGFFIRFIRWLTGFLFAILILMFALYTDYNYYNRHIYDASFSYSSIISSYNIVPMLICACLTAIIAAFCFLKYVPFFKYKEQISFYHKDSGIFFKKKTRVLWPSSEVKTQGNIDCSEQTIVYGIKNRESLWIKYINTAGKEENMVVNLAPCNGKTAVIEQIKLDYPQVQIQNQAFSEIANAITC